MITGHKLHHKNETTVLALQAADNQFLEELLVMFLPTKKGSPIQQVAYSASRQYLITQPQYPDRWNLLAAHDWTADWEEAYMNSLH